MALPLGASPVLAVLRLVAAVTVPPLLWLASLARRSPSIFTLGGTLAAFVVFIGVQVAGVQAGALGWAGLGVSALAGVLTYRAVARRGSGGSQIASSLFALAAFALDWIAFDWYWAILLVLVATGIGLGLAERRIRPA